MSDHLQSQLGVILKKISYGEADEIITVLLREEGIRRFFVAGSRKSKKRYLGLIDHFAHLKFHYKPSSKGLWRLQDIEEIGSKERPWKELNHFAFANYLAELICEFTPEAVTDHHLYELWLDMNQTLPTTNYPLPTYSYYLYKFFEVTGYALELNQCVNCGQKKLPDLVFFDPLRGGLLCDGCHPQHDQTNENKVVFKIFQLIQSRKHEDQGIHKKNWHRVLKQMTEFSQNIMQKQSRAAGFFLRTICG